MIRENVRLAVSGASEVHLTGYLTTTELLMPDPDDDFPGVDAEEEVTPCNMEIPTPAGHWKISPGSSPCCAGRIESLGGR